MKVRLSMICITLCCAPLLLGAQQSGYAPGERLMRYLSPYENFVEGAYANNPAINFYRYEFPISQVGLSFEKQSEDVHSLYEKGNGYRNAKFDAFSFMPLGEELVLWGNAKYENTKRFNVIYNETSDFDLLYPYVISDIKGGDTKSEYYSFLGGASLLLGKWNVGGSLGYRAGLDYRTVNPRPENKVSDMNISTGASRMLTDRYGVGVSFRLRTYRQSNKTNFAGIQRQNLYQMNGMGAYYRLYSGTNGNVSHADYHLTNYGASVSLFPKNKKGFSVNADVDWMSYDRLCPEVTNLGGQAMQDIEELSVGGEIAYKTVSGRHLLAAKAAGSYKQRDGNENEYTPPPLSTLLNAVPAYGNTTVSAGGELMWGMQQEELWGVFASLSGVYSSMSTEYINIMMVDGPPRSFENDRIAGRLTFTGLLGRGRSLFTFRAAGGYDSNLNNELTGMERKFQEGQEPLSDENLLGNAYMDNALRTGRDVTTFDVGLRWNYRIVRSTYLFLEGGYSHFGFSDDTKASLWNVSLGISF